MRRNLIAALTNCVKRRTNMQKIKDGTDREEVGSRRSFDVLAALQISMPHPVMNRVKAGRARCLKSLQFSKLIAFFDSCRSKWQPRHQQVQTSRARELRSVPLPIH